MCEHIFFLIFDDGAGQFQGEQRNSMDPGGPNCRAIDFAHAITLRCNYSTSHVKRERVASGPGCSLRARVPISTGDFVLDRR